MDSFSRAALGAEWDIESGAWSIVDGELRETQSHTSPSERLAVWDVESAGDYLLDTELRTLPHSGFAAWNGVAVQIQPDPSGGLRFYLVRYKRVTTTEAVQQTLLVSGFGTSSMAVQLLGTSNLSIDLLSTYRVEVRRPASQPYLTVATRGPSGPPHRTTVRLTGTTLTGGGVGVYSHSGSIAVDSISLTEGPQLLLTDSFDRTLSLPGNGWVPHSGNWRLEDGSLLEIGAHTDAEQRLIVWSDTELGGTYAARATLRILPHSGFNAWSGVAVNIQDDPNGGLRFYLLRVKRLSDTSLQHQTLFVTGYGGPAMNMRLLYNQILPWTTTGDLELAIASPLSTPYLAVTITDSRGASSSSPVTIRKPADQEIYGGGVGLWTLAGSVAFSEIEIGGSAGDAGPLMETPPLVCTTTSTQPYTLPGTEQAVTDIIDVGLSWSGHPVGQSVVNSSTHQYVAYYDENRDLTVASRTFESTTWTKKVLDTRLGWDSHNYVTMALDSTGHIHVSGNMHGTPLRYWRSAVPGDVLSLTRQTTLVNAAQEQNVTYPAFVEGPTGSLIFKFRDGWSGSGIDVYYSYNPATASWAKLLDTPLTDGEGVRNAYVSGPARGADGNYHLIWTWRENADAGTNHDLYYARSADLVNWTAADGAPLSLPIREGNADLVDAIPMYAGMLNGWPRLAVGDDGRTYVAYAKYDATGNHQLFVAAHEGAAWSVRQLTDWTGRIELLGGGSLNVDAFSPRDFSILADGNLALGYRCSGEGQVLVIDPDELDVIAQTEAPPLFPEGFLEPESDFPGIQVHYAPSTTPDGTRYVLRWETMPRNQDQPYTEYEDPQPIRIYRIAQVEPEGRP